MLCITKAVFFSIQYRFIWSADGIDIYQQEVASKLSDSRITRLNPLSKTSMAGLLSKTNDIFIKSAELTKKVVHLKGNTI